MLRNYIVIAFRNLLRHKFYALINIFGLAVGLAFSILTLLYVRHELSYDTFHANAERIYRICETRPTPQGDTRRALTPAPLGPALRETFPEVVRAVRVKNIDGLVRRGDKIFEERLLFADPDFFATFSFSLLQGDPHSALERPDAVILSATAARKYFGDADPLGQILAIRLDGSFRDFSVSGVAREIPANSSIRFDLLLPYGRLVDLWGEGFLDKWGSSQTYTYILLDDPSQATEVVGKLPAILGDRGEHAPPALDLQPLTQVHLDPSVRWGLEPAGNPMHCRVLTAISLFVLLTACINFTNLSIGLSAGRAREIGMRKVAGALRGQLMRQFWGEAFLQSFLALLAGIALAELFLPTFNSLVAGRLDLEYRVLGPALIALMTCTGLAAGGYPALVLSGFRPVEVLKDRLRLDRTDRFSRLLVIIQFALCVFFIVAALVMSTQVAFLKEKDLGFATAQVVVLPIDGEAGEGRRLLDFYRNELSSRGDIVDISGTSFYYEKGWSRNGFMRDDKRLFFFRADIDHAFFSTLGIAPVQGTDFVGELTAETQNALVVNETLVREFGWQNPLGERLGGAAVVGVVRDYHFQPLHREIAPMALFVNSGRPVRYLLVRLDSRNLAATIAALADTWRQATPGLPFRFSFLDEEIGRYYHAEKRWTHIVVWAALFAVFIACLGAFGLASLAAARRTKEIGIRKVLGASPAGLVALFSREFVGLVAVAALVAWPLAYYTMEEWLRDFAYRTHLGVETFALGAFLTLLMVLIAVGFQAMRAALANPVDALRYE